jgi:hypothetical protein
MKRILVVASLVLLASCGKGKKEEAEEAVRTYLARLVDAYRTSDESLVDPLLSDAQALKLVGLIGVKRDAGVVLDAKLLELQFLRTAREDGRWVVETKERWYYRDRKIGSGVQVGDDSTDSYRMRYTFVRKDGRYILEELAFVGEPQVGRKAAPVAVDPRVLHGLGQGGGEGAAPAGHPRETGAQRSPAPSAPPAPAREGAR